ncbi:MAG: hypothetical protein ACMZ63_06525 [Methylotenera sp.]
MRSILLLVLIVLTGQAINGMSPDAGFYFGVISIFVLLIMPRIFNIFEKEMYSKCICSWLSTRTSDFSQSQLKMHNFSNGKLRFKVSDAQMVYSYNGNATEYWFACGHWWLGSFKRQISVYSVNNNELSFVEKFNA